MIRAALFSAVLTISSANTSMPTRNTRGSCDWSLPVTLLTMITDDPIPAPGAASASSIQRRRTTIAAAPGRRQAGGLLFDLIICRSGRILALRQLDDTALFRLKKRVRGWLVGAGEEFKITGPKSRYGRDRRATNLAFR